MSRTRIVIAGVLYVALTALTKLVGLGREFLLLSEVGVGRQLDQFLLVFGLPNMLAAFVVPIVYFASVRRTARLSERLALAKNEAEQQEIRAAMANQFARWGGESLVLGLGLFVVAAVINVLALYAVFPSDSVDTTALLVAGFCALAVLFSINAEYSSGVVTALGAVGSLVWCNVIINVPTVLYMLLFEVDVTSYALVLSLSFAARTIYLLIVIKRRTGATLLPRLRAAMPSDGEGYDLRVLYGSAITTASVFIFVAMRVVTSALPENSTTYYYYALKIFDLYNTTVWFVAGAFFLSNIQNLSLDRGKRTALTHLAANFVFTIVGSALLMLLLSVFDRLPWQEVLERYRAHEILRLSLFAMPLVMFGPMLDLFQRVCATFSWHGRALTAATIMTLGSFACAAAGVALLHSVEGALIGTSCGFGLGFLAAMTMLFRARG